MRTGLGTGRHHLKQSSRYLDEYGAGVIQLVWDCGALRKSKRPSILTFMGHDNHEEMERRYSIFLFLFLSIQESLK